MDIFYIKSIIFEMKISLEEFNSKFDKYIEELVNLKIRLLKLFSLRNGKKKNEEI